ncbi:hypothetical protein B0H17DRAFT_238269 [Mycena rosella]|uniref:Uncharacterized protein n=1 Tax=Mycena rosella TaxID=1033263 RepID=A0AAD7H1J4_MYCRO|nr:hypothetical protein B0H17DRAFT_238269 [Mycena rosella]
MATHAILFFEGKAWCPKSIFEFQQLPYGPERQGTRRLKPIFVLVDSAIAQPPGLSETIGWPVYAVSSNEPGRFREFKKHRGPALWGLDLWNLEDLHSSLEVHARWPDFLAELTVNLRGDQSPART